MKGDNCSRRKRMTRELIHDWDELNIAFKSLILIGLSLLVVVIAIAFASNGAGGIKSSLEVVFRTTLASVFGFLLSSNIKVNASKRNDKIKEIKAELKSVQSKLESLEDIEQSDTLKCDLDENDVDRDINIVQIIIAVSICIICMVSICILLVTDNLENVPAVSQIRDLMCSSIGFLIGESGKK